MLRDKDWWRFMGRITAVYFGGCFGAALSGTHSTALVTLGGLISCVLFVKWILGDAW